MVDDVKVSADPDKKVSFVAAEAQTVRPCVQLDDANQPVLLIPHAHRVVVAGGRHQSHHGTAAETGDSVQVVIFRRVVVPPCRWRKTTQEGSQIVEAVTT